MGKMSINSDDLKYGIECCIKYMACAPAEECCDLCPYHGRCSSLEKDALDLIQQLEIRNGAMEKALDEAFVLNDKQASIIRSLNSNNSQVRKALQDNGFGSLEELLQAYSQVKRERDALKNDLYMIVNDHVTPCFCCKIFDTSTTVCEYEGDVDCFTWRGVPEKEENDG